MRLSEVNKAPFSKQQGEQLRLELARRLNSVFGDLSTEDWNVFLEVQSPRNYRDISGKRHDFIRVLISCYPDHGDTPSAPEEEDHIQLAIDLVPLEIKKFFKSKSIAADVQETATNDVQPGRVEFSWDIEL